MRLLSFHKELPNIVLVREHPPARQIVKPSATQICG